MPRFGLCRADLHSLLFSEKTGAACRHNSERFEECQEFVTRSISSTRLINRLCQSHRPFFQFDIGVDVDLCRLNRFMAQPKGDNRSVHTAL